MKLDPRRFIRARLADSAHRLPFRGRFFGDNQEDPGFEIVDTFPGLDAFLLRDGSIVPAPKEEPSSGEAPSSGASRHLLPEGEGKDGV